MRPEEVLVQAPTEYDLIIVGAGSGNMLPDESTADWRVAIVESDRFGGTCLNRGCIPSKMFVYAADVARHASEGERFGLRTSFEGADWPAIRDRVFDRIDPIHDQAVAYRRSNGIDVHLGSARFVAPKVLEVDGRRLTADRIVLASGTRPYVPTIDGIDLVGAMTSDDVMRMETLPESMLVLGGGVIAAEMGHVFASLGTRVTWVHRGSELLEQQDAEVRARFGRIAAARFDLRLSTQVERFEPLSGTVYGEDSGGLRAHLVTSDGSRDVVEVERLLVATGRIPNSDLLDVAAGGLEVDAHGHLVTDETYATNVPGVWAFGDSANHYQLKHVANAESRIVRQNLVRPGSARDASLPPVPAAVFTDPQIATVGLTEDAARAADVPYVSTVREYSSTAYGWAMEDTTSFVKLLADPLTHLLIGAHVMGPQASLLIQPLLQAMALGTTVDRIAQDVMYIHPALTEVVENALLDLVAMLD
jgi:mycothione reductase